MTVVLTSFSAQGFEEYGRRFCETFEKHWQKDVQLYVVSEDELPDLQCRAKFVPLQNSLAWVDFEKRYRNRRTAHGRQQTPKQNGWTPKKLAEGYNFRYDAYRFAKKAFAIDLIATSVPRGRFFWLDGDIVTFDTVTQNALNLMLPAGYSISCLDRGQYHSECGFVGYNLEFPETLRFIEAFAMQYASGDFLDREEWHDSWIFDWLRRKMNIRSYHIPHQSRSHPMANSRLSRFLDHVKGARKKLGRTPKTERTLKDDVAYWK